MIAPPSTGTRRTLTLYRMRETPDATYGRIEAEDCAQLCVTCERPWIDANNDGLSDKNVSRIPAGEYRAFRRKSPSRGYELFELEGVPGRQNIQIHRGNVAKHDSQGCILVGSGFGNGGVTGSKLAFEKLMRELRDVNEFTLRVVDP